jgi:uncharacterized membrane protein
MSDLVCIAYDKIDTADAVLNELRTLQVEHLIDLEDACVVVRDDNGKVHLKQSVNLVATGATSGAMWGGLMGLLVGLVFLNPLIGWAAGLAIGAGSGALSGKLGDYGINDDFIKSVGSTITKGTSALFVLVRSVNTEKVLPEVGKFGGALLKTSLSSEQDERLRKALAETVANACRAEIGLRSTRKEIVDESPRPCRNDRSGRGGRRRAARRLCLPGTRAGRHRAIAGRRRFPGAVRGYTGKARQTQGADPTKARCPPL